MSTVFAIAFMVLVMALVGYALSRLAEPPAPAEAGIHPDSDSDGDAATPSDDELVEEVNRRLPQTQCAQCGHPGCRPYAEAIIRDNAPINQCPPGGEALIVDLATLLGCDAMPLDSDRGQTKPAQVALIVEPDCIGCTLCIAACPVDAIVGAQKHMHTVIASQCTGCELCLPPCPVDCIKMSAVDTPLHRWQWPKPA